MKPSRIPDLWVRLALLSLVSCSVDALAVERTFNNPTKNGMRRDKCLQGAGWGFLNPARCDAQRVRLVANEYCRGRSGYVSVATFQLERHLGNHTILTFPKDQPNRKSWTQTNGADAFKSITCNAEATAERPATVTYRDPTVNGMFIDWCVQGAGWAFSDPGRCDETRQQLIANRYCAEFKRAREAVRWTVALDVGSHAMLTYPKNLPRSMSWTQGAGGDRFKTITCQP